MGGNRRNGNISKGNKGKKGRRRTNQYADYEDGVDKYGRIYKLNGVEHLDVELPTPNEDGETIIACRIPGRFYKKVWFNIGQFVVVGGKFSEKLHELKGRVPESEANKVKRMFDNADDGEDIGVQIGGDEDEMEEDHDDMMLGVKSKTVKTSNDASEKKVSISTKVDNADDDSESIESIDLDDL